MEHTDGNPEFEEKNGECPASKGKDSGLLENAIEKLKKKFPGGFDDAAIALINRLHKSLLGRRGLRSMARTSSLMAFRGAFPRFFGEAAQECHNEFPDEYAALFGNKGKYYETMLIMADLIYKEFTQDR